MLREIQDRSNREYAVGVGGAPFGGKLSSKVSQVGEGVLACQRASTVLWKRRKLFSSGRRCTVSLRGDLPGNLVYTEFTDLSKKFPPSSQQPSVRASRLNNEEFLIAGPASPQP